MFGGVSSAPSLPQLLLSPHGRDRRDLDARLSIIRSLDDPEWDKMRERLMRASCAFFAQETLLGPAEAPYNGRFLVADHHMQWDKLITSHDRVCILAPRDHGKTFLCSFAYPIWQAIRIPNGSGFIFSASAPQAERILFDVKNEIENNPKLQWLYPNDPKRRWSSSFVKLANGHRIYARGFGTKVRGGHPNWIDCDDVLGDQTAYSETVRLKEIEFFYTAISNMVVPGGQILVVGTPLHCDDIYGELSKNARYAFARFKALNDDGQPLWAARYSKAALLAKREEIGTVRFAREQQCEPITDDMSLFPKSLFYNSPTEQRMVTLGMPMEFWEERGITRFMAADFALSSNVRADYSVIWVMGLDSLGNRWIIDIIRGHGMPYQEQLSVINATGRKYEPALVLLEDNQAQRIFGDELIRTTDLPIHPYTTGVEKHALDKGVPGLRVLLENGKFRIPRGDRRSVEMTDLWINEMHNFTFVKGKVQSVGGHDDMVMACWLCNQAIRMGGFSFSFGDEELRPSRGEVRHANGADPIDAHAGPEPDVLYDEFGIPILRPEAAGRVMRG